MKIYNKIQVVKEGDLVLNFSEASARATGVVEGVTLHGVAVVPRGFSLEREDTSHPLQPSFTLVLSPLPIRTWNNIVRASITVNPEAGGLYYLQKSLNRIGMYCRHMESTNGLDLSSYELFCKSRKQPPTSLDQEPNKDLIIPSTLMCLEIPASPSSDDPEIESLQEKTRDLIRNNKHDTNEIRHLLEIQLNRFTPKKIEVQVDWISPMATLNRLGRLKNYSSEDSLAEHLRARSRKKFIVRKRHEHYTIKTTPWRDLFWNKQENIPDPVTTKPMRWVVTTSHADSDEKILCWDVFQREEAILLAIEILIPTGGMEHEWWQWIFDRIRKAHGNILTSVSSARLDGQWGKIEIVVIFPLFLGVNNGKKGDISLILRCLLELQGNEGHTHAFQIFSKQLRRRHSFLSNQVESGMAEKNLSSPRTENTLAIRGIWDPHTEGTDRPYSRRFDPNPYSFTSPLDLKKYNHLYSDSVLEPRRQSNKTTRYRLANRVIRRIFEGESISIVGAHRSGKTTVLNLVYDILDRRASEGSNDLAADLFNSDDPLIFPVRIHAATSPPYTILPEIAKAISTITGGPSLKVAKELLKRIDSALGELSQRVSFKTKIPKFLVPFETELSLTAAGSPPQKGKIQKDASPWERLEELTWSLDRADDRQGADFVKDSISYLRRAVEETTDTQSDSNSVDHPKILIAVLIDEIGYLSEWGKEIFLQSWRKIIEDSTFSMIRWVVTTSRPITESPVLSPIMNVFKEYNVGSLEEYECLQLLDSFTSADSNPNQDELNSRLRPVLTFSARCFISYSTSRLPYLLQVFLYHLYDRTSRVQAPIANKKVCTRILVDFVLPEVGDFLESQWKEIPGEIQDLILARTDPREESPLHFLNEGASSADLEESSYPVDIRKVLRRSALKGDDGLIVAPIVAYWLHSTASRKERSPH